MRKLDLDLFFQLGLWVFFVLLIWESRSFPFESRFYPQIISGITMVLLLVSTIKHFLKKWEKKEIGPEVALRRRRFFQISLVVVLATILGLLGGFLLSVLCYYVAYAFLQKKRTRFIQTLGIGLALTVLFYISFGWFLNVPLFRGWLVNF